MCFIPCQQVNAEPPYIIGSSGILIDSESGQVLYVKEDNKRMYPASTTKVLTAIIAIENSSLDEIVLIPLEACDAEGSSIGLQEGELITMEDLLYALMLNSGNDAAIAIAVHVGGSVEEFVKMMNSKASELGALNSNFTNPNGLPDENHYSSAYDLSAIAKYAMRNEAFREIVSTQTKVINRTYPDAQVNLSNSSRLFSRYAGTIGVKTGYTDAAGQCLIAATVRDDRELISVVLSSEGTGIYDDTIALMEYGYNQFNKTLLIEEGVFVTHIPVIFGKPEYVEVVAGKSASYNISTENSQTVDRTLILFDSIKSPISAGEKLGDLYFENEGIVIGRVDLLAKQDIGRNWLSYWRYVLYGVAFLVFISLIGSIRRRTRRRYFERRRRDRRTYIY